MQCTKIEIDKTPFLGRQQLNCFISAAVDGNKEAIIAENIIK
ncbi:hypothetical protein [Ihubacter sp. mB4P-1]